MQNAPRTSSSRRHRVVGTFCLAALAGLAAVVSGGGQSEAAPLTGKSAPSYVQGSSKFDRDQLSVEMKVSGACSAGKECKVEVAFKAKGDYHLNDKYPLKFKASDPAPEGVTFTKAIVRKEDGKIAEKEGSLPVGFTVAKAGKAKISGTLSLSVCSEANCVIEKLDLELEVEAK